MLKVPVTNIFEAMRVFMGSAYVNDFNMFGRTYRVTAQADGDYRLDPESVSKIRVRSTDGQMVPLGSLVTFQEIAGPERVPRYNLFPVGRGAGRGGCRHQLRPGAADHARRWRRTSCRQGVTFEWTDLSYQEAKVGRTGYYIFVLSVIFVFLALSAQYESWSLPLAIMLIVPMCLFSAAFGVWLHGREINILTQVGFVVLIALAAKNAILIVEFARQLEEQGKDTISAAVEACRLRLRPILMTSLAFTLGVVPLYLAVGAGAEMRIALGTAVFWGMIGVTLFGLIFTPVFYVVIRRLTGRKLVARGQAARAPRRSRRSSLCPALAMLLQHAGEGRGEGQRHTGGRKFLPLTLASPAALGWTCGRGRSCARARGQAARGDRPVRRALLGERGEAFGGLRRPALVGMAVDQRIEGRGAKAAPGALQREGFRLGHGLRARSPAAVPSSPRRPPQADRAAPPDGRGRCVVPPQRRSARRSARSGAAGARRWRR